MASPTHFAEGMRRVINGGSSSVHVNLEDFLPLHGASRSMVSPVKKGAGSQARVPVGSRSPSRASSPGAGLQFSGARTSGSACDPGFIRVLESCMKGIWQALQQPVLIQLELLGVLFSLQR